MPLLVAAFIIVGAIAGFWLFLTAKPTTLARLIRGLALGAIGVFGLFLAVRGLAVLDLPLGGLIVFLLHHWSARGFPGVARLKGWVAGQSQGSHESTVETASLRMTLNQTTGALAGEVLSGRFSGARLEQLSLAQLRALLAEASVSDEPSERLLETYLDRIHPGWREAKAGAEDRQGGGSQSGEMTRDEALQVLGLARSASPSQIREAHRRLMTKLHPDRGGTDYLASKINAARDILLKTL
jgi:hypothetical protein